MVVSRRGMKLARGLGWVSRAGVAASSAGERDERGLSARERQSERASERAGELGEQPRGRGEGGEGKRREISAEARGVREGSARRDKEVMGRKGKA